DEAAELESNGISVQWKDGESDTLQSNTSCDQWRKAQSTNRLAMELTIPKTAVPHLPEELHLVRIMSIPDVSGKNSMKITVATLRNFRSLILPSKLEVEAMGENHFALRGKNAGVIDYVAVQNGLVNKSYRAGQGFEIAVINTTEKKKAPQPAASSDSNATQDLSTGNRALHSGAPPKAEVQTLPPGTYALLPLVRIGEHYFPIEATDEQGKALTYTVPAKKDDAAAKKSEAD